MECNCLLKARLVGMSCGSKGGCDGVDYTLAIYN